MTKYIVKRILLMIPTLIGLSEGAIDRGNRVEILQNGRYFDRLLEDIANAKSSRASRKRVR